MEPSIKAIEKRDSNFNFTDTDLVTCDNCLVRLFAFVRAEELSFRFGVELIGSTLFLVRKTNVLQETIDDIHGYGHSFPEAYTTWDQDVRGSDRNQRLLQYNLAGLNCIVRTGNDGYLPKRLQSKTKSPTAERIKSSSKLDDVGMLQLGATKLEESGKLGMQEAGELIPQEAIFDLKIRSKKKVEITSVESFMHNLWFSQVPNFILAFHERGIFHGSDIHITDVRERVQEWESKNTTHIAGLSHILNELVSISHRVDGNAFEVRRQDSGPLEIWSKAEGWSALPSSMKQLFIRETTRVVKKELEQQ